MKKEDLITAISILLNNASSGHGDINYFKNKKHDDSVEELRDFLIKNGDYIGNPKIEVLQGLNDHGVDLLLELHNQIKIGFQIKSHVDVASDSFAADVKRQIAESTFHGIEKLYLLICAPYIDGKRNYQSRIAHLMSELSGFKTNFHCAYSPISCVGLFLKNEKVDTESFNSNFKQYSTNVSSKEEIIQEIAPEAIKSKFLSRLKEAKTVGFTNGRSFLSYVRMLHLNLNEERLLTELRGYCAALRRIPQNSREFLVSVLTYAPGYGVLGGCINCVNVDYLNVSDHLGLDKHDMLLRIKTLEGFKLVRFDDEPYEDGRILIQIMGSDIHDDFNLSFEIQRFFENDIEKLKTFFVHLQFNNLD